MLVTSSTTGGSEVRGSVDLTHSNSVGSKTNKIRQRAPRACLNCRELKVSIASASCRRKGTNRTFTVDKV